ncbi:MAG: clan AA aspartic protease [Phycisphaerae bacterium]|nr:clan AA aspartic protease [Phycisphaerae bacterium]
MRVAIRSFDNRVRRSIASAIATAALCLPGAAAFAADAPSKSRDVNIRLGGKQTIVGIHWDPQKSPLAGSSPLATPLPHPQPRLAGFSPLVAVATSDARMPVGADEYGHQLESSYVGNSLNPFAYPQFVVGYLDSGADGTIVAGSAAQRLGLTGENLTSNPIDLTGISGTDVGYVTMPIGFFAAGLSAVTAPDTLDTTALVGHSNVCGLAAPPIDCGFGELVSALIGMPFIAFYNTAILVESPRSVTVAGETYTSPDVHIFDIFDPPPSPEYEFTREIGLDLESAIGLFITTASYFPDPFDEDAIPFTPTFLSPTALSLPAGGGFYLELLVREGPSTPDNPARPMKVLVDTGAQSSVITRNFAAQLSLPFTPDFTVDVCGIGGLATNIPAYFLDYVRINALGGALEFSQAPFIVLDIDVGPGGVDIDGILGMNFFANRNVMLAPDPPVPQISGGFLLVSDPIPFAYGDFNLSKHVAEDDYELFNFCMGGPGVALSPDCFHTDGDGDGDLDLKEAAAFMRCYSGNGIADSSCGL